MLGRILLLNMYTKRQEFPQIRSRTLEYFISQFGIFYYRGLELFLDFSLFLFCSVLDFSKEYVIQY